MKTFTYYLYEGRTDCRLDAYLLDPSEEFPAGNSRPAVLICPGGAYVYCSDREAEPVAMKFLSMGYHAFVLHYSTFRGIEHKKWPEDVRNLPAAKEETLYPLPMVELGRSMIYIKQHAAEWFLNPDSVGICGFSAGGHNCALYAGLWKQAFLAEAVSEQIANTPQKTDAGLNNDLSAAAQLMRPAFCILGYPFIDWLYNYHFPYSEYNRASYKWMYLDYFGTPDPTEEQMIAASANYQVTEDNPPTFMWHTFTDESVPVMHTIKMAEALALHHVSLEYHLFPSAPHGMVLSDQSTASSPEQDNPVVGEWTHLLNQWLREIAPIGG